MCYWEGQVSERFATTDADAWYKKGALRGNRMGNNDMREGRNVAHGEEVGAAAVQGVTIADSNKARKLNPDNGDRLGVLAVAGGCPSARE